MQPLSAKSSPKRCPTENVSTAFGRPLTCQQHLHNRCALRFPSPTYPPVSSTLLPHHDSPQGCFGPSSAHPNSAASVLRFDLHFDQRGFSSSLPPAPSAKTRLHFIPAERSEAKAQSAMGWVEPRGSSDVEELATPPGPEEQTAADCSLLAHDPGDEGSLSYHSRVQSLADAERLFDELTQEKQRIEAALSRIPAAGARVSLQTKIDEVTLENRLEEVNRDLGYIRMTLKRFNILRSSVNI